MHPSKGKPWTALASPQRKTWGFHAPSLRNPCIPLKETFWSALAKACISLKRKTLEGPCEGLHVPQKENFCFPWPPQAGAVGTTKVSGWLVAPSSLKSINCTPLPPRWLGTGMFFSRCEVGRGREPIMVRSRPFPSTLQLRPYTPESTGSRLISEVKLVMAQSVLWWGTTREYCVL